MAQIDTEIAAARRRIKRRQLLQRRLEKLLNELRSLTSYWKYNDSLLCFPKRQKWFFKRVPRKDWQRYFGHGRGKDNSVKEFKALWKKKSARTIHREILSAKFQGII